MISLFIDTCDTNYVIGILKDMDVINFFQSDNSKDLSTKLLFKIDELLQQNKLLVQDIDRIFVTNGPGSFTGIRVGVTVAKTLAYSLNKPVTTVSRLELMATSSSLGFIVPYIDARRGYVFAGVYNDKLENIIPDQYIALEDLKNMILDYNPIFISNSNLVENTILPKIDLSKIVKKHWNDDVYSCHLIKPNYLKKTEAEENRDKRD